MKRLMTVSLVQLVLGLSFIFSIVVFGNVQTAKAEDGQTIEGVWELISANMDASQKDIGSTIKISRKDNGYEVKTLNGSSTTYFGNERRITHTSPDGLAGGSPEGSGPPIPPSVLEQKIPVHYSYTLSGDGRFLHEEYDFIQLYWEKNSGRFHHYEIEPGKCKLTYKRVSGPAKVESHVESKQATSSMAQVESRGEFYVLTKDGRKLTGKEANQIPLEEGSKVVTGNTGHIRMTLPDNTTFTVGPNSDLVIDKFIYDPATDSRAITANLLKGVFRWVTGKVARKDPAEMKVTVPVAFIGIRGTDFEVTVNPNGSGSIVLYFGQLEIVEKKTEFKFLLEAGQKVTFGADGFFSRPMKVQ